jgi:hypothetical protein
VRSKRSTRLSISTLALVTALVVSACGGGSEFNDAVGVAAPPGTEVVTAAPVNGGGGVPTTVALGPSAAFCQDVERLQTLLPALLQTAGQTATLSQLQALLARIEADAPADIRPDVTVVRQSEDQLIKDLTANPPNLADIGRTYRDRAFQQSLQQLGLYLVNQC